jgi:hypothetical protein
LKRRLLALGAAVLISLGTVSIPAYADAPAQQGWWTSANPGSSAAVPVTPGGPDVPANGLLVESAGSSPAPVAFAALTYDTPLPAGTAATLDLTVAAQSATTPGSTLELCPLATNSIQPDQGGPMSDAPKYDCTTHVAATVSSSGGSFHFNLAPLLNSTPLAIAILPTANVERVVLDQPSGTSLTVPQNTATGTVSPAGGGLPPAPAPAPSANASSAPSDTTGASVTPSAVGSVSATPTFGAATTSSPSPAASTQSPELATPTAATTPTTQAGGAATNPAAPVALGAATTAKSGGSFPFPAILLVVGLVAVGSLWGYAGRAAVASKPEPTAESG